MASERVLITFEVDASGAIRQVDNVKQSVKEIKPAAETANAGLAGLTKALAAIGAVVVAFRTAMRAITGSLQYLGESATAAAEQQKIFALLEGSIDRLGGSYSRLKPILDDHFLTLQRNTQFGDTESAVAMQQLIDTTGNLKSSFDLLEPTMDLAVSKGMQLENAVKLVGMVYNGQLGTLSRYGIALTEVQKETLKTGSQAERTAILVELLGDKFGGAARTAGATTLGAWQGIQNAFGDISEAIGDLFIQSNLLPKAFEVVESVLLSVATALSEAGGYFRELEGLVSGMDFQPVADALEDLKDALKGFGTEVDWELVKAGFLILLELAKQEVVTQLGYLVTIIEGLTAATGAVGDLFGGDKIRVAPLKQFSESVAQARGDVSELFDELEDGKGVWDQNSTEVVKAGLNWTALGEAASDAQKALAKAYDRIEKDAKQIAKTKGFEELTEQTQEVAENLDVVTETVKELARESELSTNETRNHFNDLGDDIAQAMGDVLTVSILGEWDNFFDALETKWKETFEGLMDDLTAQFNEAFTGDGDRSAISAFKEFWGGLKEEIDADPMGSIISGVGGAYAASQGGGGWGGAIQGAMGGAMAGLGIGAAIYGGLAAMGPAGWIIAGVLALVGGIGGFMGGGGVTPETGGSITMAGGGYISRHRDQYVDSEIESAWIQDRLEEWNAAFDGMYEVLTIFGDMDLMDLMGSFSSWSFDGRGDLNSWAQIFREQVIPDALRTVFEDAINQGLGDLGVSDARIRQLWAELDVMGTDRMIESLSTFVAAVVGMADLLEAMEWSAISDEAGMNSMERFSAMVGEVTESITMAGAGMAGMDPIQQAETALEVQQMVTQVRQAEIQMLQQINALQEGINRSIDAQIESINLGGMEPGQQSQYFLDQIVGLMDYLNSGQIGSPEELSQVMADLLGYISQYQSLMGENLYVAGSDGIVPSEWLISILEEARGLANDQLESFRQELIDQNARVIELLTMINDNLTLTQTEIEVDGQIDINIGLDPDLWAEIEDRIDIRVRRAETEGGTWVS